MHTLGHHLSDPKRDGIRVITVDGTLDAEALTDLLADHFSPYLTVPVKPFDSPDWLVEWVWTLSAYSAARTARSYPLRIPVLGQAYVTPPAMRFQ